MFVNGIYKGMYSAVRAMAVCLLCCACSEREPLLPDGLIRLGARPESHARTLTRTSVNDLAGLAAVGGRGGTCGCLVCHTDNRMGNGSFDEQRTDYKD